MSIIRVAKRAGVSVATVSRVINRFPGVRPPTVKQVREAMKEGAVDFLEKPFGDEVFLAAVRSALARQERNSHHGAQVAEIQSRFDALSERERQVLDGLVEGKANKVIAYDLGISPRTVEIYRANVMAKMQAKSLSELVRLALLIETR